MPPIQEGAIMRKRTLKHAIALLAAVATTLGIFSAVLSIADDDKAQLLAASIRPALIAAGVDPAHR